MSESKYRAFVTAAETGSITKAASLLGYTQSGVSHLIDALEQELGITLLIRHKTGTTLTPDGERILPAVRSMLRSSETVLSIADELKGLKSGSLRIGTFSSVALQWLPSILSDFLKKYPGINVRVTNGTYSVVEDALCENKLDCAFVTSPSREKFDILELCDDRLMAVVPYKSPLAQRDFLRAQELADEPFIMPAEGWNYDIGGVFRRMEHPPYIRFDMSDDFAALGMIRHGMGITILPELLIRDFPMSGIAAVPIADTRRHIGIATLKGTCVSPSVRAFTSCTAQFVSVNS